MARAHGNVQQAKEMIFCDATSSLDRLNTSVFILSTATPTSGIPLGVIVTSDEQEATLQQGLLLLKEIMPSDALYSRGVCKGPQIIMIP